VVHVNPTSGLEGDYRGTTYAYRKLLRKESKESTINNEPKNKIKKYIYNITLPNK
jgi:hypothetical protein